MKIVRFETFRVPPRWLFLRLETADGIVGWGEPVVEGRIAAAEAAVTELGEYIIDQKLRGIEDTWQLLTKSGFYRGGPVLSSAVAGIDQALWDIRGKELDVPVHELLGGPVRDSIRVYGWVGGDKPDTLLEDVENRLRSGYTAVKMNLSAGTALIDTKEQAQLMAQRVYSVRAALGDSNDLLIDMHGRLSPAMAMRVLPMIEDAYPLFVEEPMVPELVASCMERLVASTTIPIAAGERCYRSNEFLSLLERGVAVIQPDVSHSGGISETRRIAALGEVFGAVVAPHCPLGPIALAASLQIDSVASNFLIQEQSHGMHYNNEGDLTDYVVNTSLFRPVDGSVPVPQGAGLGVEVDEDAVRSISRGDLNWKAPVWRRNDGSLTEW